MYDVHRDPAFSYKGDPRAVHGSLSFTKRFLALKMLISSNL